MNNSRWGGGPPDAAVLTCEWFSCTFHAVRYGALAIKKAARRATNDRRSREDTIPADPNDTLASSGDTRTVGDVLMEAFRALTWIRTSNTNVDGLV